MGEDVHSLTDLVREGEFSFDFLEEMEIYLTFPKILMGAVLSHPDCSVEFFKKKYPEYRVGNGTFGDRIVLPIAKPLENIEVIAQIVKAKENTLESIFKTYEYKKATFKQIALNPHSPTEFKSKMYELTGDSDFIPPAAQDMFIF